MPGVVEQGASGQAAGRAADAAGGVGAGAGEVEAGDGGAVVAEGPGGTEGAELVEGDVEVHGVRPGPEAAPLHPVGGPGVDALDRVPEAGRVALDDVQRRLDEPVPVRGPAAGQVGGGGGA